MNPITIGLSDVKNVKLAKVEAYQVGDYWYLRLVYEYENTNGDKFKLEIPKMELPLKPDRLPDIVHVFDPNCPDRCFELCFPFSGDHDRHRRFRFLRKKYLCYKTNFQTDDN